jgi:uncharacterized membrane protein YtjA (UPF0391 family)
MSELDARGALTCRHTHVPRNLMTGHVVALRNKGGISMLSWALAFLVIAVVAALFGFGGIASAAAGIAKLLFFLFLIIFIVMLVLGLMARGRAV